MSDALQEFTEYFVRNYPGPNTIIHDPNWHAPKIFRSALRAIQAVPVDMVLHCPKCGFQHVDEPESNDAYTERLFESSWWELGGDKPERWTNPPHRSHLCAACGHIWRPADIPTNGVKAIQTRGKNDSEIV
jgi:hypothetical protein